MEIHVHNGLLVCGEVLLASNCSHLTVEQLANGVAAIGN
jgi:hypothetical protein